MTFLNDMGEKIPEFLASRERLSEYLAYNFGERKGIQFEDFCQEVLIQSPELDIDRESISGTKQSNDGGVDHLVTDTKSKEIKLITQCKYTVKKVDDLDLIFSKVKDWITKHRKEDNLEELPLFRENASQYPRGSFRPIKVVILTMSSVSERLLRKWESSKRPSLSSYMELKQSSNLQIIDGDKILGTLKSIFSKVTESYPDVEVTLEHTPIESNGVYISTISGHEIKRCYSEVGEALFFENIRSFLGVESVSEKEKKLKSVNDEIAATILHSPESMLSRNNGITVKAHGVKHLQGLRYRLERASIINGCQTTMCLVRCLNSQRVGRSSSIMSPSIMIKIVETENSWDIAESANFQNPVDRIDLKLAKYCRPQKLSQVGTKLGVALERSDCESSDPYALLKSMSALQANYEEVKYIFIGLFSKIPKNIIASDYTELRYALLNSFFDSESEEEVFDLIFDLYHSTSEASAEIERISAGDESAAIFKRFWEKPRYRVFLIILTVSVLAETNIYAKEDFSITDLKDFLEQASHIQKETLISSYLECFDIVTMYSTDISKGPENNLKTIFNKVKNMGRLVDFKNLYDTCVRRCRRSHSA